MPVALILNAGSSSLKYSLYELRGRAQPVCLSKGRFDSPDEAVRFAANDIPGLAAVGHRIVHGGAAFVAPVVASEEILTQLDALAPLAPLHQPQNLALVRACARALPDIPQVLCFDTAFHRTQPQLAQMFGLPMAFYQEGVRRYGFHGLSYEYIVQELRRIAPEVAAGRVIVAHLGNGASLCAMLGGVSIATTMGMTPLDGLPMGTRCGTVDPGVLLYLLQARQMTAGQIEELLYKRSGLLGLSGLSHDLRELLVSERPEARLAVDYFVYRIGRELGSLAAALGGLDGLVFTGGIGENSAAIRERVCQEAAWLRLSPEFVWVMSTNEESMMAAHLTGVLGL